MYFNTYCKSHDEMRDHTYLKRAPYDFEAFQRLRLRGVTAILVALSHSCPSEQCSVNHWSIHPPSILPSCQPRDRSFFYLDNALIVKVIYFAKFKNSYLRSKGFAPGDRVRENSHCLLEQPLILFVIFPLEICFHD